MLDGDAIVYVARVPTRRIMNVGITTGTRFPAHFTSMGRVLLAAEPESMWGDLRPLLEPVREQGWALVDQELETGIRSIAAPLHAADGTVVAAINVSSTRSSATLEQLTGEHRKALLATAASIDDACPSCAEQEALGYGGSNVATTGPDADFPSTSSTAGMQTSPR